MAKIPFQGGGDDQFFRLQVTKPGEIASRALIRVSSESLVLSRMGGDVFPPVSIPVPWSIREPDPIPPRSRLPRRT